MWDPCYIQKEELTRQKLANETCVRYDPTQISSGPEKCHREDNRKGNALELTHSGSSTVNRDWHWLSAIVSKNANNPKLVYEFELVDLNHEKEIRSSQTKSASTSRVSGSSKFEIRPGKSCQARTQQLVHNNRSLEANNNQGKQPGQEKMYSSYASRNGRFPHPQGFKQVWQVKKKTEPTKDLPQSSMKVWWVKENKQNSASTSKSSAVKNAHRRRSKQRKYRIQRIMLDDDDSDSDETHEPVGYTCCLCEDDLAFSPTSTDPVFESHNFPDVALLLCGHVFHRACLEQGMSDEQLKDPPCFICASLS